MASTSVRDPSIAGQSLINSPTQRGPLHIPSLDGLRAFAFLLVFLSHAGLKYVVPGGFGVTVFFVLSGYLITTLLRTETEAFGTFDLRSFYLRRAIRILPPLYLVLLGAVLLRIAGQTDGHVTVGGLLSQVLHWSNYYLIAHGADTVVSGTAVFWSIAVEEHFYLVFPVFYRYLSRRFSRRAQGCVLLTACAVGLLWRIIIITHFHEAGYRSECATDTRFDSLLFGCILAIVGNPAMDVLPWLDFSRLRRAVLVSLAVLIFTFVYRDEGFRYTWRYTLQCVGLLPIFAYLISDRTSVAFRFLNSQVMVALGGLSYSLYLVHYVVLRWLERHSESSPLVTGCVTFMISLFLAKLLQLGVERPCNNLRRRWSRTPLLPMATENSSTSGQQVQCVSGSRS